MPIDYSVFEQHGGIPKGAPPVARACPQCGKPAKRGMKTCSRACGYVFRKVTLRSQKKCPVCAVDFYPVRNRGMWSKHCSKKCWKVSASKRLAMVEVTCAHCARIFRRTQGAVKRTKRSFCNNVCRVKFMRGENTGNWRGGHNPNRGPAWLKLAASIRDRDEHICTRCGMTEAENGQKLDVDHILPWRQMLAFGLEAANAPSNLTSLCRKCHRWKTSTVEHKWVHEGDCLAMSEYQRRIKLPPLFQKVKL